MKITFVVKSADFSGGFRVITTLARELQRLGHDILIAHTTQANETLARKIKNVLRGRPRRRGANRSFLDESGIPSIDFGINGHIRLGELPDSDVIVATWWETAEWISSLERQKGTKIYFVQGHESEIPGQPRERVVATLKLPMHKIAVSDWVLDKVREADPVGKVSVVLNSVDQDIFSAPPRSKNESTTFGFLYSASAIKGADIAIDALEHARRRDPSIQAVSFGHCPVSRTLPLPSWCTYHCAPGQERLSQIYSSTDAWIFASRSDGFGLPILEAMACRTPVIATPVGAAPQLVDSEVGRLLGSIDIEEMADALLEVSDMKSEQWQRKSEAAYSRATSYTWSDATVRFLAALEEAIVDEGFGARTIPA